MIINAIYLVILVAAALAGVSLGLRELRSKPGEAQPKLGWVYFVSPIGGAVQEPPAPIKIGSTWRDPYRDRLPELETGSAQTLEVLKVIPSTDPEGLEKLIHTILKSFKVRGEWYDRDATLAWMDAHL